MDFWYCDCIVFVCIVLGEFECGMSVNLFCIGKGVKLFNVI